MKQKEVKFKNIKYAKLNPDSTYLFQIDCSDMPKDTISKLCESFKAHLDKHNIKNVIIFPYTKDGGKITFMEVEEK